ncbi:hypothetical protein ACM6PT_29150, partial [Klebsiella pneumoniae]
MSCPVIELAQQLIRRPSLSPDDHGETAYTHSGHQGH